MPRLLLILPAMLLLQWPAGGHTATQLEDQSAIASRLPEPAVGDNAPVAAYLQSAAQALAAGRIGEAQEAMERAESRTLIRSVRPSQASTPDHQPLVQQIAAARAALAAGDRALSLRLIQAAMHDPSAGGQPK